MKDGKKLVEILLIIAGQGIQIVLATHNLFLIKEIDANEGPTYRFSVPLYRRWIAWRWGPEKVKQEAL